MADVVEAEQFGAEDAAYAGSRYKDVVDALFANPYQKVWGREGEPPLPVQDVTIATVFGALLSRRAPRFERAAERTVDSAADLRWGPDRKGFPRLLHPNAVCLTGRWQITEDNPYTGYFSKGSAALVVARYSSGASMRRGQLRSLALVGKLFPTLDPNHAQPLRTANFITQEDIAGEYTESINAADLRNAPNVTVFRRRGPGALLLVKIASVFRRVDQQPTMRQVYPVAELGKPAGVPTNAPAFMRLLVAAGHPVIPGADLDIRDEVMAHIFDKGEPAPKRTLTFDIEVTDDGTTSGTAFRVRRSFQNWRRIGTLAFDNAVISYNGDAVIHFSHPTWREDRNDPATATRINRTKVR